MERIKVAWVCHLMNPEIEKHIEYTLSKPNKIAIIVLKAISYVSFGKFKKHVLNFVYMLTPHRLRDMAQWNTNGINEFKKFDDIDLFVVAPLHYISDSGLSYDDANIHYRFFHTEEDDFFTIIWKTIKTGLFNKGLGYRKNREIISRILNDISPEIVHVIGAECPEFSLSAVDVKKPIPLIAQLQSLQRYSLRVTGQKKRIPLMEAETRVLKRADYYGTTVDEFIKIVSTEINPQCINLSLNLALTEDVIEDEVEKTFDFVYFANTINKAVDLALAAFAICKKKHPEITLDVIGGCPQEFKTQFDKMLEEYGINDSVKYEGLLPTHDDVLKQIRYSRFALLPLKSDIISGTIRESMASGIPVITTITSGTPKLNEKEHCVLLSPIGDHQALADNMSLALESPEIVSSMIKNSYKVASDRTSNFDYMSKWKEAYHKIVKR